MPGIHSPTTVSRLTHRLRLIDCAEWAQDWPAAASDASRVEEFVSFYAQNAEDLPAAEKRAIMDLILCSFEDLRSGEMNGMPTDDSRRGRIEASLRRILSDEFDLHMEAIKYWSLVENWQIEGQSEDNQFHITPFILGIWSAKSRK